MSRAKMHHHNMDMGSHMRSPSTSTALGIEPASSSAAVKLCGISGWRVSPRSCCSSAPAGATEPDIATSACCAASASCVEDCGDTSVRRARVWLLVERHALSVSAATAIPALRPALETDSSVRSALEDSVGVVAIVLGDETVSALGVRSLRGVTGGGDTSDGGSLTPLHAASEHGSALHKGHARVWNAMPCTSH